MSLKHQLYKLETAFDLVVKLRHDLESLRSAPNDGYLAFNFFVTAETITDWIHPGRANQKNRETLRTSNIELQVCSHIANGLKHFDVEAKHHNTVSAVENEDGYGGEYYRDYAPAYYGCKIMVTLDGDAKTKYGSCIDAVSLAEAILGFWEAQVKK